MKSISIFVLLIYWSIIILAPVISMEYKVLEKQITPIPKSKSSK